MKWFGCVSILIMYLFLMDVFISIRVMVSGCMMVGFMICWLRVIFVMSWIVFICRFGLFNRWRCLYLVFMNVVLKYWLLMNVIFMIRLCRKLIDLVLLYCRCSRWLLLLWLRFVVSMLKNVWCYKLWLICVLLSMLCWCLIYYFCYRSIVFLCL